MFLTAGAGLGAAIATLSTKVQATEGVTQATILRATALLWTGWVGLGGRWGDSWELVGEFRGMGLVHERLGRLNAGYAAVSISRLF